MSSVFKYLRKALDSMGFSWFKEEKSNKENLEKIQSFYKDISKKSSKINLKKD